MYTSRMSCLIYCLEQWLDNPDFKLWYNSNHVVILEPEHDLRSIGYLPLEDYGIKYFVSSFSLTKEYEEILEHYFG